MNCFKIGGRQYRAEIRKILPPFPDEYVAVIESIDGVYFNRLVARSRPAARRALKRELERLATGPDGKRANWKIVRRSPVVRIRVDASKAIASLRNASRALSLLGGAAAHAGAAFESFGRAYRSPEVNR